MMNMYRETEKDENKEGISGKVKGFFLDLKTGQLNRKRLIGKVEKAIEKVDAKDTKKLQQIADIISKNDLEDLQFGCVISKTSLENFVAKVVLNNTNILSESLMNYYLNVGESNEKMIKESKEVAKQENKEVSENKNEQLENNEDQLAK